MKKTKEDQILCLLTFIGVITFFIGIFSFTWYPDYANKTYMSENALSPGQAETGYGYDESQFAVDFTYKYKKFQTEIASMMNNETWSSTTSKWIFDELSALGLESYRLEFETKKPFSKIQRGWNVVAIIRAPRADGTEGLFFSTEYKRESAINYDERSNSVGLLASLASHYSSRKWLSKDLYFLFHPESYSHEGVYHYLSNFHGTDSSNKRYGHGSIWGAFNIELNNMEGTTGLEIKLEQAYGLLPNLDLFNTVSRIAFSKLRQVNIENNKIYIPSFLDSYINNDVRTLLTFMKNQAIGIPSSSHGLFSRYNIDGITLSFVGSGTKYEINQLGSIIEGSTRAMNNILEVLHQSFYFYLLPNPWTYISIGNYVISLGLIIIGFFLVPVARLLMSDGSHIVSSLKLILSVELGGMILYSYPYLYIHYKDYFSTLFPSLTILEVSRTVESC
eukprot:TRINITY_DN5821_c0_g1_i2.p1 TRINITY_DN5821_c0_g1~~TRINITY_DN5821_c0_g1_i2.p1  ORF type:complete len:458 (+),score=47.63 TRINITY_DN5821_c0_g1_i2:31-1374(+)